MQSKECRQKAHKIVGDAKQGTARMRQVSRTRRQKSEGRQTIELNTTFRMNVGDGIGAMIAQRENLQDVKSHGRTESRRRATAMEVVHTNRASQRDGG
eukprot:3545055-Pleurochrysis_carterae.AAC.1